MQCWNLTYNDAGRWDEVYSICGRPLSFWQTVKKGGSGSPRGVLVAAPGVLGELLDETSYVKYCNVQRMSDGVLVYCKVRLEVYGIPVHRSQVLRIESSRRRADAFEGIVTIVLSDHRRIDIACSTANVSNWQRFLNGALKG